MAHETNGNMHRCYLWTLSVSVISDEAGRQLLVPTSSLHHHDLTRASTQESMSAMGRGSAVMIVLDRYFSTQCSITTSAGGGPAADAT